MSSPLRARLVLSLALIVAAPALAFDFVVTRYDDPAPNGCLATDCSLREAILDANADPGADRVLLSGGAYAVGLDTLSVTADLEIAGVGAGITALDATGLGAGKTLLDASALNLDFTLRGVTLRNSSGTGLGLAFGTHTVEDCEIRDHGITAGDAGIATSIGAAVTLRRVTVTGNSGYGLLAVQSSITVENSTFSANDGTEIQVSFGVDFSCTHCTVFDPADDDLEVAIFESTAGFANSIVAGSCFTDATGAIDSAGGNVESPGNGCDFDQGTDQQSKTNVELALGALADNGGPTRTHLPGASSAATGGAFDTLCLAVDQRAAARTTDCESGAVERVSPAPATPIFLDGFLQGDTQAWSATAG